MSELLQEEETVILDELLTILNSKAMRNQKRREYHDAKNRLDDLGISIPTELKDKLSLVVGWPAKAVDDLAACSQFEGFTGIDADSEDLELSAILDDNNFRLMYPQLTKSELMLSCAFVTVSEGAPGEPEVLVNFYSAEDAVAVWCPRLKRVKYGATIIERCDIGKPAQVNLYLDYQVIELLLSDDTATVINKHIHNLGRPPMEAFVNEPSLDRPFGRSRISRAVMSIADSAVRQAFRSEVAAELYASPQRYASGIDAATQEKLRGYHPIMGSILSFTPNEDGEKPEIGQFSNAGILDHIAYERTLAAKFSGETGIPVSSLGIIHDNPPSAEAINATRGDLVAKAEQLNLSNGVALRNVALMIKALKRGVAISSLSNEERAITPRFRNPARISASSRADAIVKLVTAFPWLPDTEVALEEAGFTEDQIVRLISDRARGAGSFELEKILARTEAPAPVTGAQITRSVLPVLEAVSEGTIQEDQAISIVALSIGVSRDEARSLVRGSNAV